MNPDAVVRLVAARCLTYPDEKLYEELPLLRRASGSAPGGLAELRRASGGATGGVAELPRASGGATGGLAGFLDHVERTPLLDLAAHYTDTFDTRNRRCLYLTWWTDGDTRRRGLSLVRIKRTYRAHGLEFDSDELPDFLPAALEFAALHEEPGTGLLQEHRAGLELLRLALADAGTPYAGVLEAVCGTLPGPSPETKEEAKALARSGPPRERVGLDPLGIDPLGIDPLGLEPRGPGVELPWPTTHRAERTPV
ncbi:nitrate reductase molybdenum cofactor assembly chaperone [Streptomyces sp. NPDC085479]|uniref:nitrate reductase molybdenum cofactor assembly chaperone n=1 Tax=Streptomyces sp. NPDC085479 TaxID=3365726 RepID=UPI0037CCE194